MKLETVDDKLKNIEVILLVMYSHMGIDKPQNHDQILGFIFDDIEESSDADDWNVSDVSIGFRRWMEAQTKANEENYFQIIHSGYQHESNREEIQIHCGDNGNLFLVKNDEGFVVDVYNQQDFVDSMIIWEDDLESCEEDEVVEFSEEDIDAFVYKYGLSEEDVKLIENSETWFYYNKKGEETYLPDNHPHFTEEEELLATFLKFKNEDLKLS